MSKESLMPDLFGKTAEDYSIDVIKEFEPPEGYYLAFSGGKDSCVLLELAKRAGVKYDAYYNVTTIDPPELVRFIRTEYPEVEFQYPKEAFFPAALKRGIPTRQARWCCDALKEWSGIGRRLLTGVRHAESRARSEYMFFSKCQRRNKWFVNPIVRWSDVDVWAYIHGEDIPYCSLYDEGFSRIGCILCPCQRKSEKIKSMERWPHYWKKWEEIVKQHWAESESAQRVADSAEGFWLWWLDFDRVEKVSESQTGLFT